MIPNRGKGSHGCNLLLALELSWHYVVILFVKWTILLCTIEYLILDWRCVFVRGCVCLLVHFWSVSFSAVYGRDEHTQRNTSVQHTDWLTEETNGDSLEAEIVQLAQISGTDVMNACYCTRIWTLPCLTISRMTVILTDFSLFLHCPHSIFQNFLALLFIFLYSEAPF